MEISPPYTDYIKKLEELNMRYHKLLIVCNGNSGGVIRYYECRRNTHDQSVEIKSCVQLDEGYYQLAAVGRQSSKYYELVLDKLWVAEK
jgi:hypothetical protein